MIEQMELTNLIRLVEVFSPHVDRSEATVSNWITGTHARLFSRLRAGHGCSVPTFNKSIQWFSDHWPDDLAWPSDIPRPPKTNPQEAA